MKMISYLNLACLALLSCINQSNVIDKTRDSIKSDVIMENFNIEVFNKNKNSTGNYSYILENKAVVTQFGNSETGYFEYTREPKSLFEKRKAFFPSGKLKLKGQVYSNFFQAGVWYYYSRNGTLEKTIDYDSPYKFTWEQVKEYCSANSIKLELSSTRISRDNIDNKPVWTISWLHGNATIREVKINATSGEFIGEKLFPIER